MVHLLHRLYGVDAPVGVRKLDKAVWRCLHYPMFSRFDTIPSCDRRADRQTNGRTQGDQSSRGKKLVQV